MKITMMMAMTLDGKIAKNSNHFPDWTSKEDKKEFFKISKEYGIIIMGGKTFATFPAPLPNRLNVVYTQNENPPIIENVKWVSGDINKILQDLEKNGHTKALLCGGSFLNTLFLERGLIDEIIITIEPKIFGQGLSLFNGDFDINLELQEIKKLNNNTLLLNYKVLK